MVSYTTTMGMRDPDKLKLTREEALEMQAAGLRFSEFNLESRRFCLSVPYRVAQNLDRGTLTFMQD